MEKCGICAYVTHKFVRQFLLDIQRKLNSDFLEETLARPEHWTWKEAIDKCNSTAHQKRKSPPTISFSLALSA